MPKSFLITNRRYRTRASFSVNSLNVTNNDVINDRCHSADDSYCPGDDMASTTAGWPSVTDGRQQQQQSTLVASSLISGLLPDVINFCRLSSPTDNSLQAVQQLFPALLELAAAKRFQFNASQSDDKEQFYQLDDKLNEFVERTPWLDTSPPGNCLEQRRDVLKSAGMSETDTFSCSDCTKRYSTASNLARHRQTHRPTGVNSELEPLQTDTTSTRSARQCPHCSKVYVSLPAYSMHVRTHTEGCACPQCGKRFSRPWLLQGHLRTHTGERPFRCPQCSKTFADKSNLRAHIQTHSSLKPYVCTRCGKAFALKSYLYKHEESSCMRSPRLPVAGRGATRCHLQPPYTQQILPVVPRPIISGLIAGQN